VTNVIIIFFIALSSFRLFVLALYRARAVPAVLYAI
jgi:hypothetical protein